MAIPFPNSRIQRSRLVRAGVPEDLEMLFRAISFRIKRRVHPVYDFLIRASLEWYHLALIVESEIEV